MRADTMFHPSSGALILPLSATCCMIPTLGHSGKGKTMEIVKDQWLLGVGGVWRSEEMEHRGCSGQ